MFQGIYLFSVMAESTSLQKLSLDGNDLSMVPPQHLAKGSNLLQEVTVLTIYSGSWLAVGR